MKTTKSADAYERFVQEVFQSLVDQSDVDNVTVEHNVTLSGRSGATHQIDVFWEFRIGKILYRTCVECRDYSRRITKGRVAEFIQVTEDIGNATGIMVTTVGFQSGALAMAKHHNIRLLVVNPMLREIHIDTRFRGTEVEDVKFDWDSEQVSELVLAAGRTASPLDFRGRVRDFLFFDAVGNRVESLEDVVNRLEDDDGTVEVELRNHYVQSDIGFARVRRLKLVLRKWELPPQLMRIAFPGVAKAFVQDVLENTVEYVHDDGTFSTVAAKGTETMTVRRD